MKQIVTLLSVLFLILFSTDSLYALENQFVTIVNPVRIAPYTKDSSESIHAEYQIIRKNNVPATWLLTYDVLSNQKAVNVVKTMDPNQEIGIFLEVGEQLCVTAKVTCNKGSWHHANVIFLSGYKQEDRKKLIDTLFALFHEQFGFYPKSVGSWWTDAYSLSYMKERYGVTANLTCSDQFSTDGYQIWGQYWMHPYMPSKYHAGMPATSQENQLDMVTIQWAPREPYNGYLSSLYSTQDYQTKPLDFDTTYFENLIKTYGFANRNSYGQITVGLEGDYNPHDYIGEYTNQIDTVTRLVKEGNLKAVTMSSFSEWYRNTYPVTQTSFIESHQFESDKKAFWYSSNAVRIGMVYDDTVKTLDIIDFRSYFKNFQEPYYISPNKEIELTINNPSYIDSISNKNSIWTIPSGTLLQIHNEGSEIVIEFEAAKIKLNQSGITIEQQDIVVPENITLSNSVSLTKKQNVAVIQPNEEWSVSQEGVLVNALSESALNELRRKRTKAIVMAGLLSLSAVSYVLLKRKTTLSQKVFSLLFLIALFITPLFIWYQRNLELYYVSQSEIAALEKLFIMPPGNVLVYSHHCIGCEWSTPNKPAAFANQKRYVKYFSSKNILYNASVFEAKTQEEARKEFQDLNASYLYLVKYESMHEKPPFSPGDLNIEKVYSNANAEIWRVK